MLLGVPPTVLAREQAVSGRPAREPAPTTLPSQADQAQQQIWADHWEQFRQNLAGVPLPPLPGPEDGFTDPSSLRLSGASRNIVPFDSLAWSQQELGQTAQTNPVEATDAQLVPSDVVKDGALRLMVNQTRIIRTTRPYYRVSVASPDIADVTPLAPDALMVTARTTGATQLVLWDENDRTQTLLVNSEADMREINDRFDRLLPDEQIEVVDLRGQIALRGRVSSVETAQRALQIAEAYADNVVDFMEINGTQQVMLEIRFAEVSRSAGKALGLNFGVVGQDGSGASNIGGVFPFGPGTSPGGNIDPTNLTVSPNIAPGVSLFGGGIIGDVAFQAFLSALRENNLLRVLAEPNLTLISGEEGEFLAGGEIPIPVPQGDETLTIEYKSFGIKLRALPVVMGDGRIRVRVEPEVSDIDPSTGVTVAGVSVPGFRVRHLSTEVEMLSGQTFVLAGLLDSSVTASKQATPILGDVPILGTLFRSVRYQRRETELVVLITPRLVSPLNPDEIPPLPGEDWKHPTDRELFLNGELGGEAGVSTPHQGDVGGADNAATRRHPTGTPQLQTTYTFLPVEPAKR
jgi:pilus assembly protein CpaC